MPFSPKFQVIMLKQTQLVIRLKQIRFTVHFCDSCTQICNAKDEVDKKMFWSYPTAGFYFLYFGLYFVCDVLLSS